MKHAEEIMEILEAFDLTRSFRSAGPASRASPLFLVSPPLALSTVRKLRTP